MAFFQNPFSEEFRGTWPIGDRSFVKPLVLRPNTGRGNDYVVAWNMADTYDLSGNDANGDSKSNLIIRFAYRDMSRFMALTIPVAGATAAATTPAEIVAKLNADTTNQAFSTYFLASTRPFNGGQQITITSKKSGQIKFYIVNSGAEEALGFNKKAGVKDLPTYFSRHTVDNAANFPDSLGSLLLLSHPITLITKASPAVVTSPNHGLNNGDKIRVLRTDSDAAIDGTDLVVTKVSADTFTCTKNVATTAGTRGFWAKPFDANIIANAINEKDRPLNLSVTDVKFDAELLQGQSPLYMCKKQVVDSSSRVLSCIEYPAGSIAGDLARKTVYTYTGAQSSPDTVVETPYTLTNNDILSL